MSEQPKSLGARRVMVLAVVAGSLCAYLLTLTYGFEVLALALVAVMTLAGIVALAMKFLRMRQLSMRTLVFILPLPVAGFVLLIGELSENRQQQAVVMEAGVHAEYTRDGIYGSLNEAISRVWNKPYHPTFPSEIFEIGFDLDCQGVAKLQRLHLPRLQRVRIFQLRTPAYALAPSTVDWLNRLPDNVAVGLMFSGISTEDAAKLRELRRPLENLQLLNAKLTQAELAAVLAIPTESLTINGVVPELPDALAISPSRSRAVVLSGLPLSQAIKLARWKECSCLTMMDRDLSLPDCDELAALGLEELNIGKIGREQLQVLMETKSLKRLSANVVGADKAELQQINKRASPGMQLNLGLAR